jgi:DMSO/TMAO reductase YedYZ molybdopterin-dependent catalytic subunit
MTERPRLTRRDFFRLGAVAGPTAIVAACGWDGGPALESKLRGFSRINDWVGEKLIQSSTRLAPEYPASARTPAQDFPSYSITYNRTGSFPSPASLKDWVLDVGGLVQKPIRLSRSAIEAMPSITYTVKHHCVEGWTAVGTWTGVPLTAIVGMVRPTERARYLRFDSFDSDYYNGWDLKSAMHPQTILAYAYNDRPLMMNHGAPLRLYSPIKLGYKLTKYLTGMKFTSERPGGYWEDQGYPWFGGV